MNVHPTIESLLAEIALYRARTGISVTAFGKGALNDPHLIGDLRKGRNFGVLTLERIRAFMRKSDGIAA